ncbi:MAG TPA: ATP-binding protein [Verrucomicrobiae bacterium]|nr:ATP-binding protein [Verrucomicrobiae bacterium]
MKIFKSIRWRLQLWYGLVLLGVLAGFGITAYQLQWGRQMRRVDDELHRRFAVVAEATHPHPPGPNGRGMPMDAFPGPPRDDFGGQGQRDEFHPPLEAAELFDTNDPDGFYFVVMARDDKEIARGGNVPARYMTDLPDAVHINRPPDELKNSNPPPVFTQNEFRQMADTTPAGETIVVGCSIAPELKELHHTAWELAGIGGIILFCGLAGGWWISSRAIKPVENINAAALKISAGDLSQRINVAETESELGQLAATLNATFARLQAAFELQKQFASDAAHELRTPVSVILTQTQTALKRPREAADYQETIEACQRAAQRMKKMISTLLELARLDAGQEQMQRLPFDFSQTVREGIEAIQPLAAEKHVQVVSELAQVRIVGDTGRLGQVVSNLLTNAIQYNHEGGEVRVKLERRDGFAVLTVSDNGLGIASEDLPHIFERFYRGDRSRSGMNAGLGLAICQAIVVSHGGSIEAAGAEGSGAIFTVRLPC